MNLNFTYTDEGIRKPNKTEYVITRPSGMPTDLWRQHAKLVCKAMEDACGWKLHESFLLEYPGDVFVTFTPDSDGAHTLGAHRTLAEAQDDLARYSRSLNPDPKGTTTYVELTTGGLEDGTGCQTVARMGLTGCRIISDEEYDRLTALDK